MHHLHPHYYSIENRVLGSRVATSQLTVMAFTHSTLLQGAYAPSCSYTCKPRYSPQHVRPPCRRLTKTDPWRRSRQASQVLNAGEQSPATLPSSA